MKSQEIFILIQHFHGCPNGPKMIERVREAIKPFQDRVIFNEIIIDNDSLAKEYKFRGSPTLLINGEDFEHLSEPDNPSLTCRIYKNGLPTIEEIRSSIEKICSKAGALEQE